MCQQQAPSSEDHAERYFSHADMKVSVDSDAGRMGIFSLLGKQYNDILNRPLQIVFKLTLVST